MNSPQLQPDGQLLSAPATAQAAIKFSHADYAYARTSERLAVNGVSLEVALGEYLAVVGGNGSGKSTLSKMVNALLVPGNGQVLTLGLDTASTDEHTIFEIRSQAGLVLQNPDSQMVASVVADDVAFGPENLCVPHDEMRRRVDDALQQVMMSEYRDANPARLSGGQKQRVCIAGLLAMQPRVLVLDEPAAMLDVRGRRGIRRVLRELHAAGLTVVLVTHFMEEAAEAQRIVVLNDGEIVLEGAPREVFNHKALLRSVGLDVPFSVQLSEELSKLGLVVPGIASPHQLMDAIIAGRLEGGAVSLADDAYATAEARLMRSCGTRLSTEPAIVLDNVSFSYFSNGRENRALEGVSLRVERGEFLGVVGHTGSGKSTLLQLMAGLIKAGSGQVVVDDIDLSNKKSASALHSKLGMVFQYPERQLFAPTVAEDIAFGPQNAGLKATQTNTLVREAMQKLELNYDRYAQRSPFELSGGEKRRVAIAGVIATDPDILIFDEPTAGLDPHSRGNVLDFIKGLHASGKTVILASHSMDTIAELSTKVLVLDHGKQAMLGTPEQVFNAQNADKLRQINLGLPQATQFALELDQKGLHLPEGLFTAQALAAAIGKVEQGGEHDDA